MVKPELQLITHTLDSVIVVVVPFVTPAAVPSYRVLTPSVLTHPGEFRALVDVLPLDEPLSLGTQFQESWSTGSGTRFAFLAPASSDRRTTTQVFVEETINGVGALPVLVANVTLLLSYIHTERTCKNYYTNT